MRRVFFFFHPTSTTGPCGGNDQQKRLHLLVQSLEGSHVKLPPHTFFKGIVEQKFQIWPFTNHSRFNRGAVLSSNPRNQCRVSRRERTLPSLLQKVLFLKNYYSLKNDIIRQPAGSSPWWYCSLLGLHRSTNWTGVGKKSQAGLLMSVRANVRWRAAYLLAANLNTLARNSCFTSWFWPRLRHPVNKSFSCEFGLWILNLNWNYFPLLKTLSVPPLQAVTGSN